MRLLKITVKDFRAYSGECQIDLTDVTAAVVCGLNGAGKSSLIIDAPRFAFFGSARKYPEKLINDLAESMYVIVDFSHNGAQYTVQRTQTGSKQTLRLWEGVTDITELKGKQPSLTQTQKKLDELLGFSEDFLLSTAIAQQEDITKLSDMTPGDREQILSEMLGNSHWEGKKEKVNKILNDYKDLDKTILVHEECITARQADLEVLHSEMAANKKQHEYFAGLVKSYKFVVDELDGKFKEYENYHKLDHERDIILNSLGNLKARIKEMPEAVSIDVQAFIRQRHLDIANCNTLISEIDELTAVMDQELTDGAPQLQKIYNLIAQEPATKVLDTVPCVGLAIHDQCQLLANALKIKADVEAAAASSTLEIIKTSYLDAQLAKAQKKQELETYKKDLIQQVYAYNLKIQEQNQILNEVNKKIEIAKEINLKEIDFNRVSSQIGKKPDFNNEVYMSAKDSLDKSNTNVQTLNVAIAKQETQIKYMSQANGLLIQELAEHQKTKDSLVNLRLLHQAYVDIPTLLFEQAIPTLEEYTNEILEKILPNKPIQLRPFRETKSNTFQKALDVVSADGHDFLDLGGSEKFRQSLALRIALSRYNTEQNNVQIGFFVVDEGFGSLDRLNVPVMKATLKELASHFDLFLVITHVEELFDTFNKTIYINPEGKTERVIIQ